MICSEFRELLDRYESIDELDRECMDAHCDFCDDCRNEMEFFKSITAISASIPCPAPPKTLIAEVNAKLDKMAVAPVGGRTKSWSIKQYATLAACLAVGIAVGVNGGYIKDRLSDNSGDDVISETVTVTEAGNTTTDVAVDNMDVETAVAETEKATRVSDGKVRDDKPASSAETQKTIPDSKNKTEKAPITTVESDKAPVVKPDAKPVTTPVVNPETTPVAIPDVTPATPQTPEKVEDVAVAPVPETTPSVNDYAMVGEGKAVAYYSVGTRDSASKGAIADYILISDEDMGAVFSIMSEMGVSSSDGYYMTNRTDFYQMLDRFDAEGIEYDYQLIHNTGKNIVFKLRYYSVVK